MVAHTFDPSLWTQRQENLLEFETSLVYEACSRTAGLYRTVCQKQTRKPPAIITVVKTVFKQYTSFIKDFKFCFTQNSHFCYKVLLLSMQSFWFSVPRLKPCPLLGLELVLLTGEKSANGVRPRLSFPSTR